MPRVDLTERLPKSGCPHCGSYGFAVVENERRKPKGYVFHGPCVCLVGRAILRQLKQQTRTDQIQTRDILAARHVGLLEKRMAARDNGATRGADPEPVLTAYKAFFSTTLDEPNVGLPTAQASMVDLAGELVGQLKAMAKDIASLKKASK